MYHFIIPNTGFSKDELINYLKNCHFSFSIFCSEVVGVFEKVAGQNKCKLKSPKTTKFGYWPANLETASYKGKSLPRFEDDGRYMHPITKVKEARDIFKKRVSMS